MKYFGHISLQRTRAPKALDVAEDVLVNDADQAEEFEKRVLKWLCGQEQLVKRGKGTLEGVSDFV